MKQISDIMMPSKLLQALANRPVDADEPLFITRSKAKTPLFKLPKPIEKLEKSDKSHFLIKRITKRVVENKWDPLVSDYFMKAFGGKKALYAQRKEVFRAAALPMIKMADVLTGILPYSCITSLSDQCGISTYGNAYYDENGARIYDANGENPKEAPEGCKKKKSVTRMWRFAHTCKDMGIIDIVPMQDDVTGAELPALIILKDPFYYMHGETPETLESARKQRIGLMKKEKKLYAPEDETLAETIKKITHSWIENIKLGREAFRKKARLVKMIGGLDSHSLWQYGQRVVQGMYSQHERNNMSIKQYRHQIKQSIDGVWREIRGLDKYSKMMLLH